MRHRNVILLEFNFSHCNLDYYTFILTNMLIISFASVTLLRICVSSHRTFLKSEIGMNKIFVGHTLSSVTSLLSRKIFETFPFPCLFHSPPQQQIEVTASLLRFQAPYTCISGHTTLMMMILLLLRDFFFFFL